ncbi:hypothetical protein EV361DRAFT_589614 [Lentinula raphanica]|nr:hypothetical protein EV361DRAFT_589614 [Lentinula raphanica]
MTRLTASQMLSLLFLGAAISPNVLAAPTLSSISSSPGFSTGVRTVQPRPSSSEQGRQGSLSELQRREVDYSNLVPRGPVGNDGSMTSNQHAQHGKGDVSAWSSFQPSMCYCSDNWHSVHFCTLAQ